MLITALWLTEALTVWPLERPLPAIPVHMLRLSAPGAFSEALMYCKLVGEWGVGRMMIWLRGNGGGLWSQTPSVYLLRPGRVGPSVSDQSNRVLYLSACNLLMSPKDFRISQTEQAVSIHFCLLISRAHLWQPNGGLIIRRNCNDKQGGGEGGRGMYGILSFRPSVAFTLTDVHG